MKLFINNGFVFIIIHIFRPTFLDVMTINLCNA